MNACGAVHILRSGMAADHANEGCITLTPALPQGPSADMVSGLAEPGCPVSADVPFRQWILLMLPALQFMLLEPCFTCLVRR
jgi:hypothetical protein